ncbi:hypothetical protein GC197_00005 [bacterium]|nr:hypothetical protein [bacterium]
MKRPRPKPHQVPIDISIAKRFAAELFERGEREAAYGIWRAIQAADPYDMETRRHRAVEAAGRLGSREFPSEIARIRSILHEILYTFPTPQLADMYFAQLETLLKPIERKSNSGNLVLGIGTGRCGSTTLAAIFSELDDCISTHENPPAIFWEPRKEQVEFHFRRIEMLRSRYQVVFDGSHWWLNVLDQVFQHYPTAKAVGLYRSTDSCVKSFMRIKRKGPNSINHWMEPGCPLWVANPWDPMYPSYPIPSEDEVGPNRTWKEEMIRRYVDQYNTALRAWHERAPDRVFLLAMDELNDRDKLSELSAWLGIPGLKPTDPRNEKSIADSTDHANWL